MPTPSASNVSFISGMSTTTGSSATPYGGVGDTVERPEKEKEKEKPERSGSAISVGVNLLKKGRAEKERERERQKEREKELRANNANASSRALAPLAVTDSSDGFGNENGPGSPRGFVSGGGGVMGIGSSATPGSSATSLIPGNLNLTVQTLAKLASPGLGGSTAGGVAQGADIGRFC